MAWSFNCVYEQNPEQLLTERYKCTMMKCQEKLTKLFWKVYLLLIGYHSPNKEATPGAPLGLQDSKAVLNSHSVSIQEIFDHVQF